MSKYKARLDRLENQFRQQADADLDERIAGMSDGERADRVRELLSVARVRKASGSPRLCAAGNGDGDQDLAARVDAFLAGVNGE